MKTELRLGFSGCPNDTAIFFALITGRVPFPGLRLRETIQDVEALNQLCLNGILDASKVSFHAAGRLLRDYALLRSGSALGRGCGPLITARPGRSLHDLASGSVGVPGRYTTAQLLLNLYSPAPCREVPMLFSEIMPAVADGRLDFGLVIHEGRFTLSRYGLVALLDLGDWWEGKTGLPIPLGGIVIKRSLSHFAAPLETAIRESLLYYRAHPEAAAPFIEMHAQELDAEVIRSHIELYVNEETLGFSREGEESVGTLFRLASERGLIPPVGEPLFST